MGALRPVRTARLGRLLPLLGCLVVFTVLLASTSRAGWIARDTGVTVDLHDITAHHGNDALAWACGDSGVIVHTTDHGATWTRQVIMYRTRVTVAAELRAASIPCARKPGCGRLL